MRIWKVNKWDVVPLFVSFIVIIFAGVEYVLMGCRPI